MSASTPSPKVFRLSPVAYLIVLFVTVGIWPIALYGGTDNAGYASPARLTPLILLFVIPLLVILFVARTATVVDQDGITVRALFGRRLLPWDDLRGLSVTGTTVYAVLSDGGAVRLPCVRINNLADIARASSGRLPQIADPRPKFAPSRRRRR